MSVESLWGLGLFAGLVIFWYVIAPRVPGLSKLT